VGDKKREIIIKKLREEGNKYWKKMVTKKERKGI
jgi:hypothetical protein